MTIRRFFSHLQLVITSIITMTVFLRTRMKVDEVGANLYMGSLFCALVRLMCNGTSELGLTVSRLSVFYKQRDFYFFPSWSYSIPAVVMKIPLSLLDSFLWTALTYYVIGYSPEPERLVSSRERSSFDNEHKLIISLLCFISLFSLLQIPDSSSSSFFFSFKNCSVMGTYQCYNSFVPS